MACLASKIITDKSLSRRSPGAIRDYMQQKLSSIMATRQTPTW
jgi:hypothetical protein